MATAPQIVPLDRISSADLSLVGRKAFALGELSARSFPVPAGFCVTTAAFEEFVAGLDVDHGHDLSDEQLEAVRRSIASTPLPPALCEALERRCRDLGSPPVAVRSSGSLEDLEGASFAGLYETILNVRGPQALADALRRCWASIFTPRVRAYCSRHGLSWSAVRMGVIVQTMIEPRVSGVMFTLNPTSGMDDEIVIESCWGLGEALVSGQVDPDRYVVGLRSRQALSSSVGRKARQAVASASGVCWQEVPAEQQATPTLDEAWLDRLVRLGARVQACCGRPQDIEWAIAGDDLFLLQSRPITTFSYSAGIGEWTTADMRDGGVSSTVCSPFMWSLYDFVWERTMPDYFKALRLLDEVDRTTWGRLHFGRMYWNVGAVKRCMSRVPGFVERNFDRDLGIEITYEGDGVKVPVTAGGVLRAIPTILALSRLYRERLATNQAFLEEFAAIERRVRAENLAGLDGPEFLSRYRKLLTDEFLRTESNYFHTIYNTSNAKLDFKVALDALNARAAAAGDKPFSYLELLSGLTDLSHILPIFALWEMAVKTGADEKLRRAVKEAGTGRIGELVPGFDEFLDRFGYHGTRELDITVPRWSEDPTFVLRTLKSFVTSHAKQQSPRKANERQHEVYLKERRRIEEFMGRHAAYRFWPPNRWKFFGLLERARGYCWWREEMRDRSTRMYAFIRRYTLELARRLVEKGDLDRSDSIWYLTFPQAIELADGMLDRERARDMIETNRLYTEGYRRFANPNEIGLRWLRRGDCADRAMGTRRVTGIPCSTGVAVGPVRVVPDIQSGHDIEQGDVLVTTFTDPGWTPLLTLVSAVVTETGGLLSHAAVISREYGIPAVLSVPNATRIFKDGQRVRVDGSSGSVEIVDGDPPAA